MKITLRLLKKIGACQESIEEFQERKLKSIDAIECINMMIKENYLQWSNWLLSRILNEDNKIKYAIYPAKKVLDIFEKKYPDDKRPIQAIKAAEKYLKLKTKEAAYAASHTTDELKIKILKYGIRLLKDQSNDK